LTLPGARARSRAMANFVRVAAIGDVPPGTGKCVEAGGKQIALFNVGGVFHAIDNTCIHRGGPLGEGELDGAIVTCPWHGWQYDVTTGVNTMDESERVERYEVKVEGDAVLVQI
jgi:nitrite reductase (NADH) small subunit